MRNIRSYVSKRQRMMEGKMKGEEGKKYEKGEIFLTMRNTERK